MLHRIHARTSLGVLRSTHDALLALISAIAPTRGCIVLGRANTLPFDIAREVVRNTEVEGRGFKLDLAAGELCPLVSRGVDPADEIEVVHVFECAEVCALLPLKRKQLPN